MQVSQLVCKMKEESAVDTKSATRKQLQDKLSTLSPSQLTRSTEALAMIWNGLIGPLDPLPPEPKFASSAAPSLPPNWPKVKLALLKSISTGVFIDTQFYAYNAIDHDLPMDPRPLFTSSIVIAKWAPTITART